LDDSNLPLFRVVGRVYELNTIPNIGVR